MRKAFTIRQGAKTVGIADGGRHYIVAFERVALARKVQYFMHPERAPDLARGDVVVRPGDPDDPQSVAIAINCSLSVPKTTLSGGAWAAMNDGGFHLHEEPALDVYALPITGNLGLILPFDVAEEDATAIRLNCHVIEPSADPAKFRP